MTEPRTINSLEHGISSAQVNPRALAAIDTLKSAGFSSQLVGGCVRDLLLNRLPKDFDICTNAQPRQIRQLFRRSKIIGRRFQLVLVYVGNDVFQISTYRRKPVNLRKNKKIKKRSFHNRVLKENTFGSIEQDALRRDLTINALYLHPSDNRITDYTNGYNDLKNGIVRCIGNPAEKYLEDPVRMLRTIRFATELNFNIAAESVKPIAGLASAFGRVSNRRMTDEMCKLLFNGSASQTFSMLLSHKLFESLFPVYSYLPEYKDQEKYFAMKLLTHLFQDTDSRVQRGEQLSWVYTMAAVLWFPYRHMLLNRKSKRFLDSGRIAENILASQIRSIYLNRHQVHRIKEIWRLQFALENKKILQSQIARNKNFRAAYRLLELRSKVGDAEVWIWQKWRHVYSLEYKARPKFKQKKKMKPKKWTKRT